MAVAAEAAGCRWLGEWPLEPDSLVHSLAAALRITCMPQFPSPSNRSGCGCLPDLTLNVIKSMNKCKALRSVLGKQHLRKVTSYHYLCCDLSLPHGVTVGYRSPPFSAGARPLLSSVFQAQLWPLEEGTAASPFANHGRGYPDLVS